MRSIRRILVAVKDPTAKSLPAVAKGAQLARAFGAHLELFHGISTPLYVDAYSHEESLPQMERRMRAQCLEQLERLAAGLRGKDLKVSVSATWDFPVYEAIVRHASRNKVDLIVAEQHAKRHILPGLLQLTDWELLRTSHVPVLLVKTPTPYRRPVILAAVDPSHTFSKPARLDDEILRLGKTFAGALRGPLHAVHAFIPILPDSIPRHLAGDEAMQKLQARTAADAQRRMERTVGPAGIPKARRHLVGRHPIDAIEQVARKTHTDIVVMGAISRSGVKRFFFGNTAEALLDSLACDLLIVKPRDFADRVQKRVRGVQFAVTPYLPGM